MVPIEAGSLEQELTGLRAGHLHRQRRVVQALPDPDDPTCVLVGGQRLRNFCSNDYLGLSTHPALAAAANDCMQRFGFGAGASHLVSGHCLEHHALEEELAAFTGRERALLFSSGYLANVGVVSALAARHDLIVADRLCHASLVDGALLSGARLRRYAHADSSAAARLLEAHARPALLLTDGVFSMDGDVAPLAELAALAERHRAWLLVDDAHGLGVLGESGRGSLEQMGLGPRAVPLLIGTLGKAFGSFGAFLAGSRDLIEWLLQQARTYIYTTALPPAVAAATRAALRLATEESWRRERLHALIRRWRAAAAAAGLPASVSSSPIQPLVVGDARQAVQLSEALAQHGFWITAIRPPTVPAGTARLRITLSAAHRESDIEQLAEVLGRLWRRSSAAEAGPSTASCVPSP